MSYVVKNFINIIKHNGGLKGTFLKAFRTDDFKWGALIGEDKFGNKYFQNDYYFFGRSRWVEYSLQFGHDYDASQIPPEWHRWMSYITDDPPSTHPLPHRKWMAEYTDNPTGTKNEYVPYTTTRPKIEAWVPPNSK
uniref:NADH dehydrogenase [ubiquinone] 1 alpha subcomplex subunit 12 n=1 Tax=Arion vulgaris TaxID=1028688 RepID=A0A0B6Z2C9_9EUPU